MFKKIGLIATSNIEAIKTTLDELVNYFDSRDYEIILDKFCAELRERIGEQSITTPIQPRGRRPPTPELPQLSKT